MVKRHLAGLIVAAVIAGGGAAAVAAAPDSGSGTGAAPTDKPATAPARGQAKARRAGGQAGAVERRMVHGDLIVRGKDGTFENVTVDKGIVQSKGDQSLTLKRADGKEVSVKVDSATKYKGAANFDGIQTGKPAIVVSKDGVARLVAQRAPGGNNTNGGNVGA